MLIYFWKKALIVGLALCLIGTSSVSIGFGALAVKDITQDNIDQSQCFSQTDWPMFQHDLHHTGFSESTAPDTNSVLWTSSAGDWSESSPTVSDGKVFIGSEENVYCLDAMTGEELWNFPTSQPVISSPAVSNGKVYVGSMNHYVYCLDANTGTCLWQYWTNGGIFQSSPAVYQGKVYIGSHDNKVYCLDAEKGTKLWDYPTTYFVSSSPAVVDDKVYIGSMDGILYCLDANTGAEIWTNVIGYTIWTSSPSVSEGRVYVGALDFELHCLNSLNGEPLWNFPTGDFITGTAALADGKIYIGSWDGTIYCLNAVTGMLLWEYLTDGPVSSSPVVADGKLYAGSAGSTMYCLDADSGEKIWDYGIGAQILPSPAIADGNVYVGALHNNVYCFGGENQQPIANFSWNPTTPYTGEIILFDASNSYDPDGSIILYEWDWDYNGVFDEYSNNPTTTHVWSNPGNFPVTVRVTDDSNGQDSLTKSIEIIQENQPPNTPTISGPEKGKPGSNYQYTITGTDPEEDMISAYILWGDDTITDWTTFHDSGESFFLTHSWAEKGNYTVEVKVKDTHEAESGWATLSVTIPFSFELPSQLFWERFFERFPNAFPFLRHLWKRAIY